MYKLSDFKFNFPAGLIAQKPVSRRDFSRLMVLNRADQAIEHNRFCDIRKVLKKGDLVILNDTKVMPARLIGQRKTGGRVEVLLLNATDNSGFRNGAKRYYALIKPLARLKDGEELFFGSDFSCLLLDAKNKIVEFKDHSAREIMEKIGQVPLPPYIRRKSSFLDRRRYQTVFAEKEGAVAAPTAGLHFTKGLLRSFLNKGVNVAYLTLHVNYATFSPVRCEDIRKHKMHKEYFDIPATTIDLIRKTKKANARVFAVGTTVCKALEDSWQELLGEKKLLDVSKESTLFIYPPYSFKIVDALITNFHLSQTSLLMLVCAFAGREFILDAYQEAVRQQYRFYSYGDAMLIV